MSKFVFIVALVALLLFFIVRRLNILGNIGERRSVSDNSGLVPLDVSSNTLAGILKGTLLTVGIGMLILIVALLLSIKLKIFLITVPIGLYLIGQFFVFSNHSKVIRNQRALFDPLTGILTVQYMDGATVSIALDAPDLKLYECKSVQKNRGILMGYYRLQTANHTVHLPYLLTANPLTRPFFEKLSAKSHTIESRLFPII